MCKLKKAERAKKESCEYSLQEKGHISQEMDLFMNSDSFKGLSQKVKRW